MTVPRSMCAALLAALLLVPALGLTQSLHVNGDPYMTVTDAAQARLADGRKQRAPALAVGDPVFVLEVKDGWATVARPDPRQPNFPGRLYRLPLAALAAQPGKTQAHRPTWAPAPGDPALAERDIVAYEDEPWIMVREGAAKPRRVAKGAWPAVSADGTLLAFWPEAEGGVTVVDLTGKAQPRRFPTTPQAVREIHFSPQGLVLAWRVDDRRVLGNPRDRIESVDLAAPDAQPAVVVPWLPVTTSLNGFGVDGKTLAFFVWENEANQLRLIDAHGRVLRQTPVSAFLDPTLDSSGDTYLPSPTSDTLVLAASDVNPSPAMERWLNDSGSALFLCDLGSGTSYRLTPRELVAVSPTWTPDGRRIYFAGLPEKPANGPHRLYRMNADGTGLTELGKGFRPSVGTRP
ncbi:TolB family protein [Solidesulfovibrio carbinolicus]|uniref:Biopolymer transporter Tol n=1 Tax=Solidesulfovibrio carbinolicus TaxID=296842 RepID=A0A4P6HLT8_9BACT|nr:PD40 domain-containing protein [Solidesulfovibrio carbinolicus]QAZ66910.1 biopolymer transporter Tol [Solidesulfovibrio carbinolicus]